jgi:hypothetical protein
MVRFSALVALGVLLSASGSRAGPMPLMPESAQPDLEAPVHSEGPGHCDQGPACCGEHCRGGCLHRFCEWLTYKPLTRPCLGDCCHHCCGCCYPPLYTFFLCQGCNRGPYGPGPCGCGAPAPLGPVTLAAPVPASRPNVGPYSAPPQAPDSASASASNWSNRAFTLVSHRTQQ